MRGNGFRSPITYHRSRLKVFFRDPLARSKVRAHIAFTFSSNPPRGCQRAEGSRRDVRMPERANRMPLGGCSTVRVSLERLGLVEADVGSNAIWWLSTDRGWARGTRNREPLSFST